jgi:hypothetical protein
MIAIVALPVLTPMAKAAIAPIIIIPSIPRFNTPDFSTTISPTAANTSGVDAVTIVRIAGVSQSGIILHL